MAVQEVFTNDQGLNTSWLGLQNQIGARIVAVLGDRAGGVSASLQFSSGTWDVQVRASETSLAGDATNRRSVFILEGIVPADVGSNPIIQSQVLDSGESPVAHAAVAVRIDESSDHVFEVAASDNSGTSTTTSQSTSATGTASAGDVLLITGDTTRGNPKPVDWDVTTHEPPNPGGGTWDLSVLQGGNQNNARYASMGYVVLTGQSSQTWSDSVAYTTARQSSAAIAVFVLPDAGGPVIGTAQGSYGFTGTATGTRRTSGTTAGSYGFTGVASGVRATTGSASGSYGFTGVVSGVRRVVGAVAGMFGFTGSATGTRRVHGIAAGSYGFTGTASGVVSGVVTGTAQGSYGFVGTAAGIRHTFGTATGTYGFTGTASGVIGGVVTGDAMGSYGFTGTATGVRRVLGTASGSYGFTGTVAGVVEGPVTVTGTATGTYGYAGVVVGVRTVHGTASGTYGFIGSVVVDTADPNPLHVEFIEPSSHVARIEEPQHVTRAESAHVVYQE